MSSHRKRGTCAAVLALLLLSAFLVPGCASEREEMYQRNRAGDGWVWGRDGEIRHPGPTAIGGGGN